MKLDHCLVKVCGMKNPENIMEVSKLKPDMMGFIFYPSSKRFVGDQFIVPDNFPGNIKKVGVFVDESIERVFAIVKKCNLQVVQLHGTESPEYCLRIKNSGVEVIKAFGIDESFNWNIPESYISTSNYFIFDTKTPKHGGSGRKFSWKVLDNYKHNHPFLLSGGIGPEDTGLIKSFVHRQCIGIDINSGFETGPGVKDVEKLHFFFKEMKK